jgi:ATP-dependent Clp protease ATP-binding subunit ClpC
MLERFTKKATRVVAWTSEEGRRLGYRTLGPEHLLLGILREDSSDAASILNDEGVDLISCRRNVEAVTGRGSDFPKQPWYKEWFSSPEPIETNFSFNSEATEAMRLASELAEKDNGNNIDIKQLLVGILEMTDSKAIETIKRCGADSTKIKEKLISKSVS